MSTIAIAIARAEIQLATFSDQPKNEAEILLAHVMRKSRSYLFAFSEEKVTTEAIQLFEACLMRRCQGEPIAYIIGTREFWSLDLSVTKDTLIPRHETELLVETILNLFGNQPQLKIADLGTGSGAIACALAHERPNWHIVATDISKDALAVAQQNASALNLTNILFAHGNWTHALMNHPYDVIVSNPPYIAETEWHDYAKGLLYEPTSALLSGKDGLNDIRIICKTARPYLRPGGCLLLEHGYRQGAAVREIFLNNGYNRICSVIDLLNYERVTVGYCL